MVFKSILNGLIDDENQKIYLYVKGFNFTVNSIILITDFKFGFSQLTIKKSKKIKFSISNELE